MVSDLADWQNQFRKCVAVGTSETKLFTFLDDILAWCSKLGVEEVDQLGEELLSEYGEDDLRRRIEEFFDRLVISNDVTYPNLFPPGIDQQSAKQRYRKLIGLFHPDRGVNDQLWLNFRAEKVNRSYEDYQSAALSSISQKRKRTVANDLSTNRANKKSRLRQREDWRKKFGDPETLQKKIIASVVAVCLLLVLSVFISFITLS